MYASINKYTSISKLANEFDTEEKCKIFVFCVWQAGDKILMIKIEYHRKYYFK